MADQTRHDILQTARQLFAWQGYAAASVTDIAREAAVAVQTIYAWLGSKRSMLMALIDPIDEEVDVRSLVAGIRAASTPEDALAAEVRLTRVFQERCGDLIGALFAAVEPDLAAAVAEGQRRHREAARLAVARIAELGGLPGDAYRLSRDDAEALLCGMLGRAVLAPSPTPPSRSPRRNKNGRGRPVPTAKPAASRRIFPGHAAIPLNRMP